MSDLAQTITITFPDGAKFKFTGKAIDSKYLKEGNFLYRGSGYNPSDITIGEPFPLPEGTYWGSFEENVEEHNRTEHEE